jgi:ethanolamine utilization protein EutL
MAYLIAPPMESVIALDAALKAGDVRLVKHFKPPTETNFGGGYLSGRLDMLEAAARAFSEALIHLSQTPLQLHI